MVNSTCPVSSTIWNSGLALPPTACSAKPNSTASSSVCSTSPLANAPKKVLGITLRMNSVTPGMPPGVVYWAMAWVSRVAGSALTPTPGFRTFTMTRPMNSAIVDTTSKYSSASPPALPTSRSLAMPAIPVTTVQKMIGAISSLISLMKPSPSGLSCCAKCGQKIPSTMPSAMAISTCTYKERQMAPRPMLPPTPATAAPRPPEGPSLPRSRAARR